MPVVVAKKKSVEQHPHGTALAALEKQAGLSPGNEMYGKDELVADLVQITALDAAIAARKEEIKKLSTEGKPDVDKREEVVQRVLKALLPAGVDHDWSQVRLIGGHTVEIGKAPMTRTVKDKQKAGDYMGEAVFWQVVSLPLKACDDYLTLPQRNEVIETTYAEDKRGLTVKLVQKVD